jgi:succinyl-CoA synthetase alpha subunit
MSIFINKKTKLLVQGITGRDGSFHAQQMKAYGTDVVGGVTPGKGGTKVAGIPVFNTVEEAVARTKANASVIYVPPPFAVDAIYEAVDAGIKLVVCITEGVPANDMMQVYPYVKEKGARLIGPNCPGLISVDQCKVGIMPGNIVKKGGVGVVSRSGTLTYEAIWALTCAGMGQTTCIGIGGDQVIGTNFIDVIEAFEADGATKAIVMIGEIGGSDEEDAARFVKKHVTKPVVAFIAGQTAPPGKRMGHAGAIISGGSGTAADKIAALNKAGIPVAGSPTELPELLSEQIKKLKGLSKATKKPAKKPVKKTTKKTAVKKTAKKTAAKGKKRK